MSTEARKLFNNAELSLAAYADLNKDLATDDPANLAALRSAGMSDKQAREFAARYPAVISVANGPNSDFQATIFQAADLSFTIAIRGTTSLADISQDVSIINGGVALSQLLSMVNWWQSVIAPEGAIISQYSAVTSQSAPENSILQLGGDKYLVCTTTIASTAGALNGVDSVNVTGHSLGGYLAMAFDGLFGSYVNQTYVYNALGFADVTLTNSLFAVLSNNGHVPSQVDSNIINIAANEALPGENSTNFAAGLHSRPGTEIDIAIEDKSFLDEGILFGIGNHSITNVTDSLAVYNLLGRLDSSLSVKEFNKIFHSSSNDSDTTLENTINAIQKLLGMSQTNFTTDDREQLYTAIYAIQSNPTFTSLTGVSVKSSAYVNTNNAKTDFSAFLSLYHLSPVYLAGAALNNTANRSIYNDWVAGKFSAEYLGDRANALYLLLANNSADKNGTRPDVSETLYYDYSTRKEIFSSGGNETIDVTDDGDSTQVHFGSAGVDEMSGGNRNDRFYGGTGSDTYNVAGSFGHDRIADADDADLDIININGARLTLQRIGKIAADNRDGVYLFLNADGQLDLSKTGWSVMVNGGRATVTARDADGKFQTIQIEGFNAATNNFAITLNDGALWAPPSQNLPYVAQSNASILGQYQSENIYFHRDRNTTNFYLNYSGTDARALRIKQLYIDATVTNLDKSLTYNAMLFNDRSISTVFEGANGNDLLQGRDQLAAGTFDILYGLDGDDIIIGDGTDKDNAGTGDDADILSGGHGNDQLYGGGGDDWLYATDSTHEYYKASIGQGYNPNAGYSSFDHALYKNAFIYNSITQADTTSRLMLELADESNYLDGGNGADRLMGGSFNDTLIGGNGSDAIYAGAGQDLVNGGDDADEIHGDSAQGFFAGYYTANFIAPDVLPLAGDYTRAYFYQDISGKAQLRYHTDLHGGSEAEKKQYNALFNDVIDGGKGDDRIHGEIGSDIINGGEGHDTLFGDRYYNSGGLSGLKAGQFQKLSARYHGDDVIDGGAGNDRLIGGGGDDVLMGGDEAVSTYYSDIIYGDLGIYDFDREASTAETRARAADTQWWGRDVLFGGKGNDRLIGEGGDDVIDGGDDADQIYGDWYKTGQQISNSDYITYGGADILDGGAGDDQMYGGAGGDTLSGSAGADTMDGEAGNDTYIINSGDGQDAITDAAGDNTLRLISAWLKNGAVEVAQIGNWTRLYTSADKSNWVQLSNMDTFANRVHDATGNTLKLHAEVSDARIKLFDSIDYAVSWAGATLDLTNTNIDFSSGFNANLFSDGSAMVQIPTTAGGNIQLTISDWAGFRDLSNTSHVAAKFIIDASDNSVDGFQLTGKSGNDTITGGDADEYFMGGPGSDTLNGGAGIDTASYFSASAAVLVNLAAGTSTGAAGGDSLSNIENIIGSNYNDTLVGNGESNVLDGGVGIDTVSYALDAGAVQVNLASGLGTGSAGNDRLINIENLTGSNSGDTLTGDSGSNVLIGGSGDDILDGGAGIDTASYLSAPAAVDVNLFSGSSTGGAGSDTLGNIENLVGSNFNDTLTGNAGANVIIGGSGDDILDGGAGIDTADYLSATAAVQVNLAAGISTGAAGGDRLANIENIIGSHFGDVLAGSDDANVLTGGLGDDSLSGGAGIDVYTFSQNDGLDTITSSDRSDVIRLRADPANVYIVRDGADYLIRYRDSADENFFGSIHNAIRIAGLAGVNTINFVDSDGNAVLDATGNAVSWRLDANVNLVKDSICTISIDATVGGNGDEPYLLFDRNKLLDNDNLSVAEGWQVVGARGLDTMASAPFYCGEFMGNQVLAFSAFNSGVIGKLQYFVQQNGAGAIYAQTVDVNFADAVDGVVTLNGAAGIDLIDAIDAAKTIMDGKAGDDVVTGGTGADTVLHRFGDGNDVINMREGGGSMDTLILSGTDNRDHVTFEQDGDNLLIHLNNGDVNETVKVEMYFHHFFDGAFGSIKLFDYPGGSLIEEWTADGLNALRDNITQMQTGSGADIITNWSGTGSMWQGYLDNTVNGLAGDDVISTKDGDDILIGGPGNDTLAGGSGNDRYLFAVGDGRDLIDNYDRNADRDTIETGRTPTPDTDILEVSGVIDSVNVDYRDLWLHQSNSDLVVNILGSADQVRVKDWFVANDNQHDQHELDAIRVSNRVLTNDQASAALSDNFDRLLQAMATWEGAHSGSAPSRSSLPQSEYDNAWLAVT